MALHLLKLCVGVSEVDELVAWQKRRRAQGSDLFHTTRMIPRRKDELLDGGSLYWVIRGQIQCRQRLTDICPFTDEEGIRRCRLMLDHEIVPTRPQPRRAFQGWRYIEDTDVPKDLPSGALDDVPPQMRAELVELGLL